MQDFLDMLKPSIDIRLGGAGNKAISMLDNETDSMVHFVPGIKFWDMCAGEALI